MDIPVYDSYRAAEAAMDSSAAGLDPWVRYWMQWMTFAFLSSVWFVLGQAPARWVLLVGVATKFTSVAVVMLFGVAAWSLAHVLLWIPLFFYLARRRPGFMTHRGYSVWIHALMITILVSLGFDAYELYLWLT